MNTNYDNSDYIYYNVRINPTGRDTEANYEIYKTNPILNKPSDYELSVVSFKIPSDSIPIFFFEDDYYYVTLSRNSTDQTEPLQFIQNTVPNVPIYNKQGI